MTRLATVLAAVVIASCACQGTTKRNGAAVCTAPGCTTVADCSSDDVDCVEGRCVECKVDSDCHSGPKQCNTAMGVCKRCVSDLDCTQTVNGTSAKVLTGLCDSNSFNCVRCDADLDCSALGPSMKYCADHRCIGCRSELDCVGSPSGSYCIQQQCARCKVDAECVGQPLSGCDATSGTCSKCSLDSECSQFGIATTCDLATRTCTCNSAWTLRLEEIATTNLSPASEKYARPDSTRIGDTFYVGYRNLTRQAFGLQRYDLSLRAVGLPIALYAEDPALYMATDLRVSSDARGFFWYAFETIPQQPKTTTCRNDTNRLSAALYATQA
ncbi:MAG: hypothetical protein HY901_07315, partial [Deltaproteobacteria bacterium]|nr:hypothetical protein [Deltaproteobacteria bacterium]